MRVYFFMLNESDYFLYDGDDECKRLNDDCFISESKTVSSYLYGDCHIFALALLNIFGDVAQAHCRMVYDEYDEPAMLGHAYVEISGVMIDARGEIFQQDLNEYSDNNFEYADFKVSKNDILKNCNDDSWGENFNNSLEDAMSFISKNIEFYTF